MTDTTPLTVLVTGCGAPGTIGTQWSLAANPDDRPIRIVGVDVRSRHAGRYLCDAFHSVPPANDEAFVDRLVTVATAEDVDVILPQVTRELPVLAANRDTFAEQGISIAISAPGAIEAANDKASLLDVCAQIGVPAPESKLVETREELEAACTDLGYPDVPVVVKPPVSNGSRGLRILDAARDRKRAFYREKPDGTYTTLDAVSDVLGAAFPPLLVMEHLPGTEYTVDVFRHDGRTTVVPRSRDVVRSGISFQGTTRHREDLIEHSRLLATECDLEYAFGFQFKVDADGTPKILECNPRVQGTMVTSSLAGANLIYGAVTAAAGEPVGPLEPRWGVEFNRYWGGIGVVDDRLVGNIGHR